MRQLLILKKRTNEQKAMFRIYSSLLILICISAFLTSYVLSTTIRSIELLTLTYIFYNEYKLWKMRRLYIAGGITKFSLILLFFVLIGIIVRGDWNQSGHYFFLKILDKGGFLAYILPIILIPLPNANHLDIAKKIFYIGALLSIPLWIMNLGHLVQDDYLGEGVGNYLPFFAAFLLGFPYVNKRRRKICFIIWAIYLVLMLLNARRNMVFSLGSFGLIAFYSCNFSRFAKKRFHTIVMTIVAFLFSVLFIASNIDVLSEKVFSKFSNRVNEDTRSGVEELFLADFAASPTEDWIFGRGLDGGYYQEMRNVDTGELNTNRLGIETGYLNNMLKGGVIYDFLIVLIMFICLFRSIKIKNIYSVYLRWVFLLFFIDLYATVLMGTFGVKSVLFWFCVSIALSKEYSHFGHTNQVIQTT